MSIDDFGTGYCNLGYLKSVPASKLKMDQSLIREMATSTRDAGMTQEPSSRWRTTWSWPWWRKVWKQPRSSACWKASDATRRKVICSGRPMPAARFAEFCSTHLVVPAHSA